MNPKNLSVLALTVVWLTGCDGVFGDGGQQGEEGARCDAIRTVALTGDEDSELGFGADEVKALVDGAHEGTLVYEAGGETALHLTVSGLTNARFLEQEYVDDGSGMEPALAMDCPDIVAIDAQVALVTDDGAFDEAFAQRIDVEATDLGYFYHELDLTALGGTFEVPGAADYDAVRAFVDATFAADGTTGVIDGQGESVDGDVASATAIPVGTW